MQKYSYRHAMDQAIYAGWMVGSIPLISVVLLILVIVIMGLVSIKIPI